jgi:hypothetical protein
VDDVFLFFGVFCAICLSLSAIVATITAYRRSKSDCYYAAILEQIEEARLNLAAEFKPGESIPAGEVCELLALLLQRRCVATSEFAANQRRRERWAREDSTWTADDNLENWSGSGHG